MKLRFLARWLAVAALFLSAASAYAYDFMSGGIYYNVLSEEDRTVEVTRRDSYSQYSGSIIIPERVLAGGKTYTVMSIGYRAFYYCNALTSVDLSSTSLTSIGDEAFYNCDALTSVTFPASLTSIGDEAFRGCEALTSVDLSSTSLTSIGGSAFSYCDALTSVDLSSTSLTSIGDNAFYNCDALTSVDLSSTSLTSIGDGAFYYCDALTSVTLPASLTSIGGSAFGYCVALTSVDLSSTSLTSIGGEAFRECVALTSVAFPASLMSIGYYAFYNCDALTSVAFPASLTSIGNDAFSGCDALTSVDLSSTSLTSIGDEAFWGCEALTSVAFPASLTSIGDKAFRGCDALTSVSFPASLTSIGYYAFKDCEALTNLTVDESNPAFASRDNVLYSKSLDTLVCYPAGLGKEVVIPEMVRSVRYDAFPGEVDTVYCQPQTPPTAVDGYFQNMFTDETLMNAVLYVPIGTKAAYMKVDPWRNFWNIEEMDFATVGIDGVTAQGEPTVAVRGGKIVVDGASTAGVIEVFSTDGRCAYRGTGTVIEGLPKGAYVVRVGKFTQKVAL